MLKQTNAIVPGPRDSAPFSSVLVGLDREKGGLERFKVCRQQTAGLNPGHTKIAMCTWFGCFTNEFLRISALGHCHSTL